MQRSLVLTIVATALIAAAPLGRAQMTMKGMEMKGAARPYAGEQSREIKALSAEETRQYLAGAGMGYAKPAELNGYPGPAHVLELADGLALTAEQRHETKALMQAHKEDAKAIGAKLVAAERELDALFRSKTAERAALEKAVSAAAQMQASYRLSHLETHRRMRDLLTPEQITQYDVLRGYASGASAQHQPAKH
jgi:Spy/CpxP family protein refolding chaperone